MRKSLIIPALLLVISGCGNKSAKLDVAAELDRYIAALNEVASDTTLTEEQMMEKCSDIFLEGYLEHRDDSVGLELFVPLITNFCEPEEAIALYEESSDLIRNDARIAAKIEAFKAAGNTAVGKKYLEITGVDAISGSELSLSSFVNGDKKVLVDFWASWCGPCRREISTNLTALAKSGKVSIVGIAVWEDAIENTRKAMSELGVSWPVIYCGGRENSPSVDYGVSGIPTLILLDTDGTIIARGHSIEEFADKL